MPIAKRYNFTSNAALSSSNLNTNFDDIINAFNTHTHTGTGTDAPLITTSGIGNGTGFGSGDVWTPWTPTYTQLTVGNGIHASAYQKIGKIVICRIGFTFGSSSSMGTNASFTLPVQASSAYKFSSYAGALYMEDNGVAGYAGFIQLQSQTTAGLTYGNAGGTYLGNGGVSTNAPSMTGSAWANGDYFSGNFTYQAA